MAPADSGIPEASDTLVQSVDIEQKLSEVVRQDKDGKFAMAQAFDPEVSGSIKVLGTTGDAVGSDLVTALASVAAGVTIVKEKTHATTQDNFDETDLSFVNFPGAS
ncbi:MAG: hypothetical protein D4R65_12700 [Verrucomicrobiaceae bacterium]|nr:MAG: hypothetical protein D4R65_12700 [Verrucomicrobiaceae bacterium]